MFNHHFLQFYVNQDFFLHLFWKRNFGDKRDLLQFRLPVCRCVDLHLHCLCKVSNAISEVNFKRWNLFFFQH